MPDAIHAEARSHDGDALLGDGRTALIVAHPGHELRIHGMVERVRPRTYVLTDGSGAGSAGRIASTTRVLSRAGAYRGEIYGAFSDASLYALLRLKAFDVLCRMVGGLADSLIRHDIQAVVGDAGDRYNPAHDVCRLMIDAAVRIVERRRGVRPANYAFPLIGCPDAGPTAPGSVCIDLDGGELRRKLDASRGYAELAPEVAAALSEWGADAFRKECLRPVSRLGCVAPLPGEAPFYEVHGARRVASGRYHEVIRYAAHVLPLAQRLERLVQEQAA